MEGTLINICSVILNLEISLEVLILFTDLHSGFRWCERILEELLVDRSSVGPTLADALDLKELSTLNDSLG